MAYSYPLDQRLLTSNRLCLSYGAKRRNGRVVDFLLGLGHSRARDRLVVSRWNDSLTPS